MPKAPFADVLSYLRTVAAAQHFREQSDTDLLARFVTDREDAAFSVLVQRHGPMVMAVCRRIMGDAHLAEDAFQATFMVLAQRVGSIRKKGFLAGWLHAVAQRVAGKAMVRHKTAVWDRRPKQAIDVRHPEPLDELTMQELKSVLDEAISALPEKYRTPLVLCYLEGKSHDQAARELGWPKRSLTNRLARARQLLREHLTDRGITITAGSLIAVLTEKTASAAVGAMLAINTVRAAKIFAAGKAIPGSAISATVITLAEEAMKATIGVNAKLILMAAMFCIAVGGTGLAGFSWIANEKLPVRIESSTSIQKAKTQAQKGSKSKAPTDVEKPRMDLLGDPLPPHALVRLGTLRLRHGDSIRTLSYSPDSKTLLSADWHGVHVWEAATGRLLRSFGDPRDRQFQDIAVSADNQLVALTMSEGDIEIWDANTGRRIRQFQAERFPFVKFSPESKLLAVLELGLVDNKEVQLLRLLDATTGAELHRLDGHQDAILSVIFSKDGKTLVTSSGDKSIRFWDIGTGKQVSQFDHTAPIGRIALAPDGKTLALVAARKSVSNMQDSTATLWFAAEEVVLQDIVTGKETHRLVGHKNNAKAAPTIGGVHFLMFTPDGKTLVSSDWTTHWWDLTTGKEIMEGRPQVGNVGQMAFSPDGSTLAASFYQAIQIWSLATGKRLPLGGDHQVSVSAVSIAPNGRTFATGGADRIIRLWDAKSGQETQQLEHDNAIWPLAFGPDGSTLLSTGTDRTVLLWDTAKAKELRQFPGAGSVLSPDGKLLVTDTKDNFVCIWDVATGNELRKWPKTQSFARAFSPDGKLLFSYDEDKKVHIRDAATGKELRHFEGHHFEDSADRIYCVAFSPDGNFVAFGGQDKGVAVYDMASGKQTRILSGTFHPISRLTFSPDSRILAVGSWTGGKVQLWEMATGQEFQQLAGHTGRILSIAFSMNGRLLLTGSADTTALAWDLTGELTGPKAQLLNARDLETAWSDLASADAVRGQNAVRALLNVPEQAGALLLRELKPAMPPEPEQIKRLISDLDSAQYKTREEAIRSLEKLGEVVAPALKEAIAANPSLEQKQRLESLLEKQATSQRLRILRAVQVLELVGTQQSRDLLMQLAKGVPEAFLTQEAITAVERLYRLRSAAP